MSRMSVHPQREERPQARLPGCITRIVQTAEIDALPVINRNFNDLAALAPGVTKTGVWSTISRGPAASTT
jgi:hypothetical protein